MSKQKSGLRQFEDWLAKNQQLDNCNHTTTETVSVLRAGEWIEVERCAACKEVVT